MRPPSVGSGRWGWAALLLAMLSFGAAACVPVTPAPPTSFAPSPVAYNTDFPDPEVVLHDPDATSAVPDFRAFSTASSWSGRWPRVPVGHGSTLGAWARGVPDALAEPLPATWQATTRHRYWAPAVEPFGDSWVMYYTAPNASAPDQCIGVAVADNVDGPYEPFGSGPIVCDFGYGGSIDPSVIVDPAGDAWLLWKNDGNCCNLATYIWSAPLAPDGLSLAGSATALIGVDQAWEDGSSGGREPWKRLIEGPAMVFADGAYWLFYSANWWDSSEYAIGYAQCTSPSGGCTKPRTTALVASGPHGAGPGGPDVVVDAGGQMWLAFHAWTPCCVGSRNVGWRSLFVSRLTFSGGKPVIGGGP